jgi:integrase
MAKKPVSRSKKPKRKLLRVDPEKALTPAEVLKLKAWAANVLMLALDGALEPGHVRDAVIALVLLGTGARRFELCAFTCGSLYRTQSGPVCRFEEAKGNKTAEIAISNETMAVVESWLAWKKAAGESYGKSDPLFCGLPGEHMSRATLHNIWKKTLATAGLPTKYGVHASRHAGGLLLLQATQSLSQVCEFLRHSSERITEQYYKHVLESDVRAGLDKAGL